MNVLVLAALSEDTGDRVTARRIAAQLAPAHQVTLLDVPSASNWSTLAAQLKQDGIEVAIGVHALLAGPFLRSLGVPYVLTLSGSDLYQSAGEQRASEMAQAVAFATRVVAFSPENRARAQWLWPSAEDRLVCVPQGIDVQDRAAPGVLRERLPIRTTDRILLLPCGLSRVKDPTYLVQAFSVWHGVDPETHLVIVGASIEPDVANSLRRAIADQDGIHYLPALPRPELLSAIAEADIVLNSSLSEGMCATLLEAMLLGAPVIARRNAGNESIVVHGRTGLLYESPAELVNWARALLRSPELRTRLTASAQREARRRNDHAQEGIAYLALVEAAAREGRPAEALEPIAGSEPLIDVLETATRLHLPLDVRRALEQLVERVRADENLRRGVRQVAGELAACPPSVAIALVQEQGFEALLGPGEAATLYLALALTQVPAARVRLEARGVPAATVEATLQDLGDWVLEARQWGGLLGITLEVLEWAQRYLRGELLRIGSLHFDLRPFALPVVVHRHRATRVLVASTADGRPIDLQHGTVSAGRAEPRDAAQWEVALEPGSPILQMWMPGSMALMSIADIVGSVRNAQRLFAQLSPEVAPVGTCGESWRLDHEILRVLPMAPGIQDLARFANLLPSNLSEARTIRRLFGPGVERADLANLAREKMDPVRRAIADHLAKPGTALRARAGFILREELERVPQAAPSPAPAATPLPPEAAMAATRARLLEPSGEPGGEPSGEPASGRRPGKTWLVGTGSDLGAYRLQELLGAGGMGQVYLAEHRKLGRQVAIKLLLPELSEDPEMVRRFFHEARVVNRIKHENIVEIFDFVEEVGGLNYLIMELLDGQDLSLTRRQSGPFTVRRTIHILRQVCAALEAAHAKDVVHRDLKPDNVFLTQRTGRDDFVKLLDFGIAKTTASAALNTRVGAVLGTPVYMAPEQAEGRAIDGRADLYSLGVLMHWMLFDALPPRAALKSPALASVRTDTGGAEPIPGALLDVMLRCLRFEPDERPPDAAWVRAALGAIDDPLVGPGVRPGPARPASPSRARLGRRLAWVLAAGVAATASTLALRDCSPHWPRASALGSALGPAVTPRFASPGRLDNLAPERQGIP